jgi:hypothetical protein
LGIFKRIKRDISKVSKSSDAMVDVGVKRGSESASFDDQKNTKRGRSLDVNSDVIMIESVSIVTVKETGKKLHGGAVETGRCSDTTTG